VSKAVTYGLIGLGVVVVIGGIAYVATRPSSDNAQPQFSNSPQQGNQLPNSGDAAVEAIRGGFGLANTLADRIAGQVQRDRDIAARERREANDRERQDLIDMGKVER